LIETAFAMSGAAPQGQETSVLAQLMPIILLLVIFYFLLIRPQQKRAKEHREMVSNLKQGARVVTSGGIHGTISSLDDTTVTLEIAEKVKIKVARGNIAILLQDTSSSSK